MRERIVQAGETGDYAVDPGEFEDARHRRAGHGQQHLAASGPGPLVRLDQGRNPRRVAEPGTRQVDHERRMPGRFKPRRFKPRRFKPGRFKQRRAQPGGIGDVDFIRGRHHRHAPDHLDGEAVLTHLHHLP
ncbi:MAG TPA: hypothetical protein VKH61_20710 [Streptosporangiaceae bacterium]|nr:hypothetical protein [Streptosporangiaceae bacterium]